MMFQRDFRRILDLFRRAAHHGTETRGGHRGGAADLGLAPRLRPRDRRVVFHQTADRRRSQQEIGHPRQRRARHEI